MSRVVIALLTAAVAAPAAAESGNMTVFSIDRLERHFDHEHYALEFDLAHGNEDGKYVLRFEGGRPDDHDTEGELQLLFAKPVSAYFDLQFGIESALHDGGSTQGLVVGFEGEAPFRIELEARATFNEDGDIIVHAEFERDFLITQRFSLQPRIGVRTGEADEALAAEMRARFEISRRFVPYVGVSWERIYDEADTHSTSALAGVSFWF